MEYENPISEKTKNKPNNQKPPLKPKPKPKTNQNKSKTKPAEN